MLLLVAVDDKGHVPARSDAFVKAGLAGALLAELAIDGQLTVGDDGRVRTAETGARGISAMGDRRTGVMSPQRDHLVRRTVTAAGQAIGGFCYSHLKKRMARKPNTTA